MIDHSERKISFIHDQQSLTIARSNLLLRDFLVINSTLTTGARVSLQSTVITPHYISMTFQICR